LLSRLSATKARVSALAVEQTVAFVGGDRAACAKEKLVNGDIVGYDPGGNGGHGVARLRVKSGRAVSAIAATLRTTEQAIRWITEGDPPKGLGIDTLTVWSTGSSGWRPADRYLREKYPAVKISILSPNWLFGAMAANGMAVIGALRGTWPSLVVSETHPKVLYYALTRDAYSYEADKMRMEMRLSKWLGLAAPVTTQDDNDWDALVSAWAVFKGLTGEWPLDLHQLPTSPDERLIAPFGPSHYYWPKGK